MFDLTSDLEYSHSFLNLLHSLEQGEFAFNNVVLQLHPDAPPIIRENIKLNQENFEFQNTNLDLLWENQPLFKLNWKGPETDQAKSAFEQLIRQREHLVELSSEMIRIFSSEEFGNLSRDDVVLLLAALARSTYSYDNFVRGQLELAKATQKEEQEKQFQELLTRADTDIKAMHSLLDIFKQGEQAGNAFASALFAETVSLAGAFRAQIHDTCQLLAIFDGPFSFTHAGIPEPEAADWHSVNIQAFEAGYWRAYQIGPDEIFEWKQSGINNYAVAGMWRGWGFPANVAAEWIVNEFTPSEASIWANSGISSEEAADYRTRGINSPAEIKE